MTAEAKLRALNARFDSVRIYRRLDGLWGIEARRALPRDSRDYAPYAWAPTVAQAIGKLYDHEFGTVGAL